MKEKILIVSGFLLSFGIGFMIGQIVLIKTQKPNQIVKQIVDRSLDKYTIDNLAKANIPASKIQIESVIKEYPNFTSYLFSYNFDPSFAEATAGKADSFKKVTGMINIPKDIPAEGAPILAMIRGYVNVKDYFTGNGTYNSSFFFANNGFITISPDFLGYGGSDKEADNIFESRFQTYTTEMVLLNSFDSVEKWDHKNVEIWAHSNGGNIALTTLEVTGKTYPTTLWAPVSSSFPFSILYYSDETDDSGKSLRKELSKFEEVYDTDLYSLSNYLTYIKAPIELNQGTADEAVPVYWSDNLAKELKGQGLIVNYNIYKGADHNMEPGWNTVIQKDLQFFKDNLK
ncbi:hypothetical protein BH10PAT1_BH10PAT1_3770 [soil metagenome]